jgi:hypothetical protein
MIEDTGLTVSTGPPVFFARSWVTNPIPLPEFRCFESSPSLVVFPSNCVRYGLPAYCCHWRPGLSRERITNGDLLGRMGAMRDRLPQFPASRSTFTWEIRTTGFLNRSMPE